MIAQHSPNANVPTQINTVGTRIPNSSEKRNLDGPNDQVIIHDCANA